MTQFTDNPIQYTSQQIDNESFNDAYKIKINADYTFDKTSNSFLPTPAPLINMSYDYVGMSNADANGNYQTIVYKTGGSGGTTVRTLSMTYDAASNVTSIARS